MQLLFMDQWLTDSFIKAICWTLIHSLWQGLILVGVAGILILLTRKSAATLRYNLLATLFVVFVLAAACTFAYELNSLTAANTVAHLTQTPVVPAIGQLPVQDNAIVQAYQEEPFITRFTGYFNQHASLIVTIWFIVFLAKAVKLVGGLAYIQRIRHHKVHTPAAIWTARLQELARKLGVQVQVRLLESGLVKVPLVTGFLKPVILVPLGLMANLPPDQVEAILLHELAHIRRRDFIVNLVQSFAEIVFFFNPAVLWLSSLLREEREHCCDDMAIAVTRSKKEYIEALVSFQEYQIEGALPYAMAFPGKKNQLLNRVKRIIDNSNKSLNKAEKSFLALCLCMMCVLSVAVSRSQQVKKPAQQADTTKKEKSISDNNSGNVAIPKDKGQPVAAKQQGAREPAELQEPDAADHSKDSSGLPYHQVYDSSSYRSYEAAYKPYTATYAPEMPTVTDTVPVFHNRGTIITGVITTTHAGKEYKITVDKNKTTGLAVNGEKVPDNKLPEYYPVISRIYDQMAAEADRSYNERMREQQENTRRLEQQNNDLLQKQADLQKQLSAEDSKLNSLKYEPGKLQAHDKLQLRTGFAVQPDNLKVHVKTELKEPKVRLFSPKAPRNANDDIIDDLVKEGIIKETNPLVFTLSKEGFTVNGVGQPELVKKRFQDKYMKGRIVLLDYSRNGNTTHSNITSDE